MSQLTPPPELPPHYYLDNFQSIVDVVSARYDDVLSETERNWLAAFSALPKNAQLLMVRLLTRKGNWFRLDKLQYPEIEDIDKAVDTLSRRSFISVTDQPPFDVITRLMTKGELLSLYAPLSLKPSLRKPELVAEIAKHCDVAVPPLPTDFLSIHHDVMPVLLLLYFGNSRQDLSQFVLSDLGIYRFEKVHLRHQDRLFSTREQIADWLFLSALSDDYWQYNEAKQTDSALTLRHQLPKRPTWTPLARKWDRLANLLARDLERKGEFQDAEALFAQSFLPPARERQARLAIKHNDLDKAVSMVEEMLTEPYNEDEAGVAARIARQLAKKTAIHAPDKLRNHFGEDVVTLPTENRVEIDAVNYFAKLGWQVWYSENSLLNALFGLLLWDIIFAPVPGAFLNPFQRAPRDMYSPDFYLHRQTLIDDRLRDFKAGKVDLLAVFDEKSGISNDWVNWSWVDKAMLDAALVTLAPQQIIACVQRILFDPKSNRAGHPDLFMVKDGQCQFVEVKGPGDKLQHHQVRWLNYLCGQHLPCTTLYVQRPPESDSEMKQ